jgi:hypothetical protein
MGADWNALDASVRSFHGATCNRQASGRFQIYRGRRTVARIFASLLGLPAEGRDVVTQLAVEFQPASSPQAPGREIWRRKFANRPLRSAQYMKEPGVLSERFGIIELSFHLSVHDGALLFESIAAALALGKIRLVLPSFLTPYVQATVTGVEGPSYRLDVSVQMVLALIGPVLSYEGYLDPEEARP